MPKYNLAGYTVPYVEHVSAFDEDGNQVLDE